MTFLAEVIKQQQFNSKAIAALLGQKRKDGLWVSVGHKEIVINNRDLNLKQLILLELDPDGSPLTIIAANSALVDCLRDWSLRLSRFDTIQAKIDETKKSLEYQSTKFNKRNLEMNRRDELLIYQEKKLQELQELTEITAKSAQKQHDELEKAWIHLHYKKSQLKDS